MFEKPYLANDMLLFLRDADVVDDWLKAQQALLESSDKTEIVDLEKCEKEIQDLERQQGHARAFEERLKAMGLQPKRLLLIFLNIFSLF